jgi:rhamnulokinase
MSALKLLAFDLGAESGRGIVGAFDGGHLSLSEAHRFPNGGVPLRGGLYWDILRLHASLLEGIRLARSASGPLDGIGIDTWGVDFALLGRDGSLLGNPRHYRDPHTEPYPERAFHTVPREEVFRQTGIQLMRFNTLFQLMALKEAGSVVLESARHLLFIPDFFHFALTGVMANELTDASTSQMLDAAARAWARPLVERFGVDTGLLGEIVQPGTALGPLQGTVARETGAENTPVIAVATHDTASAVASVPAEQRPWAYISSGTWSLVGVEAASPVMGEAALQANFTNEIGFGGTVRLLKNVMGLWLVQECRRAWERAGQSHGYDVLMRLAAEAPPFGSIVDPDHASFYLPDDMPSALAAFCVKSAQQPPVGVGAVIRCALESLALRYRWVLEKLESLTGQRIEVVHVVGGGSQNELLCQLTADCTGRLVLAGPVEATAIGNILVQAIGLGKLSSLADAREVVRRSFAVKPFEPRRDERWEGHYQRFLGLLGGNPQ